MNCRSCGAEIFWRKTTAGKMIPLDREPVADGNLSVVNGVAVSAKDVPESALRYVTHFATCPNANAWRRS